GQVAAAVSGPGAGDRPGRRVVCRDAGLRIIARRIGRARVGVDFGHLSRRVIDGIGRFPTGRRVVVDGLRLIVIGRSPGEVLDTDFLPCA
ncbi:hypothetical protein COL27_32465, partial [Bacillus sp. AFS075960]